MRRIGKRFSVVLVLALLCSILVSPAYVSGSTIQKEADAPISSGDFTPQHGKTYVEPTNGFTDGNPAYYLVTHNQDKENDRTVKYKNAEYPLAGVAVVPKDFNFHTQKASDGVRILSYEGPGNITVFFDEGVYNDTNTTNYTALSRPNNSYIGLGKDGNGESTTTITRDVRTDAPVAGLMVRNLFYHPNLYFENLKFDGKNADMVPVQYRQNGRDVKNRGEALIFINGSHTQATDGFVMRDIVIENVGDTDSSNDYSLIWGMFPDANSYRKNVAINIHFNPGTVNLENITVRNTRTALGLGAVTVSDSPASYLKNIKIDMSGAHETAYPVKVETTATHRNNPAFLGFGNHSTVVSSLSVSNVANSANDSIYVQDYQYKYVGLPDDYIYAVWNTTNGGLASASFNAYKKIRPASANTAIHDLKDHYWVVDADSSVTIEEQLSAILKVMNYTAVDVATPRSPRANIKIFSSSSIPSFTVPDGYASLDTHIVAVPTAETLYSSKTLVPTVADIEIKLPANNQVKLYNFDFFTNPKYTMYEAIEGITPLTTLADPADLENGTYDFSGYPNYQDYKPAATVSAKVTNSSTDTFVNCQFAVLASALEIENPPAELVVGTPVTLTHKLTESKTLATVGSEVSEIDDPEVLWFSSDESVVTVDATGKVTPVAEGEVTLFVKAKDTYNNGEIEKPFASIKLNVVKKFNLTTFVDGGNGSVSEGKTGLSEGSIETVTFTPDQGYEIDSVTVNGIPVTVTGNSIQLTMNEDKDVVVRYKKIPVFLTTKWLDIATNAELKTSVTALQTEAAGKIDGYTYVRSETDAVGNVTHYFKKIVIPSQSTGKIVKPSSNSTGTKLPPAEKLMPRTGEESTASMWAGFMLIAVAGAIYVFYRKKSGADEDLN